MNPGETDNPSALIILFAFTSAKLPRVVILSPLIPISIKAGSSRVPS